MSATYNPIIRQYSTWEITVTLNTPQNTPFDLSDYTGESQIREANTCQGITNVLATPVVTIYDAPNGVLKISLTKTETGLLKPTSITVPPKHPYPVWDVLLTKNDLSETFAILEGYVIVKAGVTQWV